MKSGSHHSKESRERAAESVRRSRAYQQVGSAARALLYGGGSNEAIAKAATETAAYAPDDATRDYWLSIADRADRGLSFASKTMPDSFVLPARTDLVTEIEGVFSDALVERLTEEVEDDTA
jgi:hypothetical protein